MRKLVSLTVLVGMLSVMMVPTALAVPGETTTCQQGADNTRVGPWEEWDAADVEELLRDLAADRPDITEQMILARLAAIMGFNDHNGDGLLCVMVHYLPNDASGTDTWWSLQDNHYDPPQANG